MAESASVLTSTKKIIGLPEDYEAFDSDLIMFINSTFSTLHQLGIGPVDGVMITGSEEEWDILGEDFPQIWLNMVKNYVYLSSKMQFDPPATSFGIEAGKSQIAQLEWRLSVFREETIPLITDDEEDE